MEKPVVEKIFKVLFPELEIQIKSFEILKRNQLNENNEWIEDTPSIFVGVTIVGDQRATTSISETLSNMTSYEFNVFTE